MRLLTPFSGKFKYKTSYFPLGKYKSPRSGLENINFLYNVSNDEEYEYCIQNYDKLLEKKFKLFDNCKIKKQPLWDLGENPDLHKTSMYDDRTQKVNNDNIEELPKKECKERIELLAWYESAHFHKSENYGIHLIPVGIVHTAEALLQNCKNHNLIISRRMAVVWAMSVLYCHELIHSWIEDIASLIEFATGYDFYTVPKKNIRVIL